MALLREWKDTGLKGREYLQNSQPTFWRQEMSAWCKIKMQGLLFKKQEKWVIWFAKMENLSLSFIVSFSVFTVFAFFFLFFFKDLVFRAVLDS